MKMTYFILPNRANSGQYYSFWIEFESYESERDLLQQSVVCRGETWYFALRDPFFDPPCTIDEEKNQLIISSTNTRFPKAFEGPTDLLAELLSIAQSFVNAFLPPAEELRRYRAALPLEHALAYKAYGSPKELEGLLSQLAVLQDTAGLKDDDQLPLVVKRFPHLDKKRKTTD
jgi:hypothetical protein